MAAATRSRAKPSHSPEPTLGWTYLSREDLARAKAQMDEETKGVRDEIGFLTIHQGYADLFFPGTSVLHTRARYALFVPWLFEDVSPSTGPTAIRSLREKERVLAGRLRNAQGENHPDRVGTIGGGIFPEPSTQPPSTVYWNALATWGILRPGANGRAISRAQAHHLLSVARQATDDDGQPLANFEPPFVNMPAKPENWLEGDISLRMKRSEAEFLREHLARLRPRGRAELSLLARLARLNVSPPDEMYDEAVLAIAAGDRGALIRARQASYLSGIGRAVYDALLEIIVEEQGERATSTRHRDHLAKMVIDLGEIASELDIDGLESDIGVLPKYLRPVLEATKNWLISGAGDLLNLYDVYNAAEVRKGPRARLAQTLNGRSRRAEWATDAHGLSEVLHYRWGQVRALLTDISDPV